MPRGSARVAPWTPPAVPPWMPSGIEPLQFSPRPAPVEEVRELAASEDEDQVGADTFALDADEVTPKWMMCSRCGQASAQPLCEACQEAYHLLRAFSLGEEQQ